MDFLLIEEYIINSGMVTNWVNYSKRITSYNINNNIIEKLYPILGWF